MAELCFVHGLLVGPCACVVSSHTPPPCYPCLVMIALLVSPVSLISFSLFNPLVFAVLCRYIVFLTLSIFVRVKL